MKSYWGLHSELTELRVLSRRQSSMLILLEKASSMELLGSSDRSDSDGGTSGIEAQEEKMAQNQIAAYLLKVVKCYFMLLM